MLVPAVMLKRVQVFVPLPSAWAVLPFVYKMFVAPPVMLARFTTPLSCTVPPDGVDHVPPGL